MTSRIVEHRRLVAAVGLSIGLMNTGANAFIPAEFARDQLPWMFAVAPMFLVGALLIIRVPANLVGWLLLTVAVAASFGTYQGFEKFDGWLVAVGAASSTFGIALLPVLLLVFPDGSLPSPRWRPAVGFGVSGALLGGVNGLLTGGWGGDPNEAVTQSPLHESTRSFTAVTVNIFFPLFALAFFTALASLLVRYRSGSAEVRHQLKWLLAGAGFMALALLLLLATSGASSENEGWVSIPLAIGIGSVPVSIGIAVLRYRLYDIDVVISKSVTYVGLAAGITALYATVVVGPLLVIGATDDGGPGLLLPIVATAVVALLFEPIRSRMQRWANRLVYGDRASPHDVLSQVTARLSDGPGSAGVDGLARLLAEGTGADRAVVWMRSGEMLQAEGTWSADELESGVPLMTEALVVDEFTEAVSVRHEDEELGALSISKPHNDPVTPADRELLADVAAGAALVLRNMRLNNELEVRANDVRESRRRLIAAQDAERHRLERDLHDGAQQQVVALKVKLGIAGTLAQREGADEIASRVLALAGETQDAVDSLRAVAHGIYPPLLESEGLEPALRAMERSSSIPIAINASGLGRYDRSVEETAFFFVVETLERARMSGASSARIVVAGGAGDLVAEIEFQSSWTDIDLGAVADRINAAGGTLTVEDQPERGRRIVSLLPISRLEEAKI